MLKKICSVILLWVGMQSLYADFQKIHSLSGDFVQEIRTLEGETITYKGKVYVKKPHFARWDYMSPIPKELYSDGKQVLIYEPLLEQVTVLKVDQKILNFATLLKQAKKRSDGRFYTLVEGIEYKMSVDKKGLPLLIEYKDEFDNHVKIMFSNTKADVALKNSLFIFTPPVGVQIDTVYHGK